MKKNVIITGATGMVGSIVLRECLASDQIETITSITRKSSGIKHEKLTEVIHDDFLHYDTIAEHFRNKDTAYFCLGVYTGQVPDDKFKEITVEYTKVFADALERYNENDVSFCFLSGAGADRTEKSRTSFARYKGMAENYLLSKKFKQLYLFRPMYIYPVKKRVEPNIGYRISRFIYPLMKTFFPNSVITSEWLGKAIFTVGVNGAEKETLENKDIKNISLTS